MDLLLNSETSPCPKGHGRFTGGWRAEEGQDLGADPAVKGRDSSLGCAACAPTWQPESQLPGSLRSYQNKNYQNVKVSYVRHNGIFTQEEIGTWKTHLSYVCWKPGLHIPARPLWCQAKVKSRPSQLNQHHPYSPHPTEGGSHVNTKAEINLPSFFFQGETSRRNLITPTPSLQEVHHPADKKIHLSIWYNKARVKQKVCKY